MFPPAFPDFLRQHPCILGEGAVIERLRRQPETTLDPRLVNSAFVYRPAQRAQLAAIYRQYLHIGRDHGLPLLMSAPTWRANAENIAAAGCSGLDVNADNVRFLQSLRAETGDYAAKVVIGGLIGCRGDAYRPDEALDQKSARVFHAWQAGQLAATGVDFLLGITLPALGEATGLAAAMAATGRPFVISFVVRPSGTLLDGTPLKDAVAAIDARVQPPPVAYLINCTHPGFARAALLHPEHSSALVRTRILGLLANTAALSPEDLDGSAQLIGEEPARFAAAMQGLRHELGLQILGGCCGTDDRHIRALAGLLAPTDARPGRAPSVS
jgi:homocysteine S-methyltransferase